MIISDDLTICKIYNDRVNAVVRKASDIGGFPEKLIEYLSRGNQVDTFTIKADDISDYSLLVDNKQMVRSISFATSNVDWQAIEALDNLRGMSFSDGIERCSINLHRLKSLTRLDLDWSASIGETLNNLKNLRALTVRRLKTDSLEPFGAMPSLQLLEIVHSRTLKSIKHLTSSPNINSLRLVNNSVLEDISGILTCHDLKRIYLTGCKRVKNYTSLAELSSLDELVLEADLNSLSWMARASSLRSLRFSCKLNDGNIDFLKDIESLEFVRFQNRRNQSLKWEEMAELLSQRGYDQDSLSKGLMLTEASDYE